MNTKLNQQQAQSLETLTAEKWDYFNFEQWAVEVKRQMLASLQKRGAQRDAKSNSKKHQSMMGVGSWGRGRRDEVY